jgi:hypothetical protein
MTLTQKLTRFSLVAALLGSLSACVVAPAQPVAYRGPAVYVETYPTYRTYPNTYYDGWYGNRYYDNRSGRYYRDDRRHEERRYEEPRRIESPLDSAARTHRDIRRSLGLPRLPGMP